MAVATNVEIVRVDAEIKHAELSYQFIGAAMQVHTELGPGQDEQVYHHALKAELEHRCIPHRYKPRGRLIHRGIAADEFEAEGLQFRESPQVELLYHDIPLGKPLLPCFLLDGRCVVRVEALYDCIHAAQCATLQAYMRHLEAPVGLLVNFGNKTTELRIFK